MERSCVRSHRDSNRICATEPFCGRVLRRKLAGAFIGRHVIAGRQWQPSLANPAFQNRNRGTLECLISAPCCGRAR
jgi:hypothetical protein